MEDNDDFEDLCNRSTIESALEEYWSQSKAEHSEDKPPKGKDKVSKMFVKGPVPLAWLIKAASLKGKCLHIGVVLWFLAGLCGNKRFRLEHKWLTRFGVSRWAVMSNLRKLKLAGLIGIHQKAGRCPVITIIDRKD